MDAKRMTKVSKFMSLVLRHEPGRAGVVLDAAGWVDVGALLAGMAREGVVLTRGELEEVVRRNDKKRFAFSEDGTRIRASQGHSVGVELGYGAAEPPGVLFHGTVERFIPSIRERGLLKGQRHDVHLSEREDTAAAVGARRGEAVVLRVRAGEMYRDGFVFRRSANGVWLTEEVPAKYLEFWTPSVHGDVMNSVDTNFYVLRSLASDAQLRMAPDEYDDTYAQAVWSEESFTFATITCAADPMHVRAPRRESETIAAEWGEGRRGDVAWTCWGDLLVNSRVLELLRGAGVTGYSTRPVRVGSDEMHWFRATGWGGMASAGSKIYRAYRCEACGHVSYKVRTWPERVVDVGRWDGSDVFMVWPMPMYLFVTGRVARLLAEGGVRGMGCYPEGYAIRRSSSFSPGRLSFYMAAEIARARCRDADITDV